MIHITKVHITLSYGCILCDNFKKDSMTMHFHKEIDHKNS